MRTKTLVVPFIATVLLVPILSLPAAARQGTSGCCKFETGDELELQIVPAVQKTEKAEPFVYSYEIASQKSGHQDLFMFAVTFVNNGVEIIDGKSSVGGKPSFPSPSTLRTIKRGKIVKVGWTCFRGKVPPGGRASFEMLANSPPVISDVYYEGWGMRPHCTCEDGKVQGYYDLTPYGPGKVEKGIGPGIYPSNRHEYIAALKRQFDEARKLGWVRSTDAAKEIEEALGNIQTEMQRGLWYKTTIPVFLAKLKDMKNNKQINAETYYLLSVNLDVIAGE